MKISFEYLEEAHDEDTEFLDGDGMVEVLLLVGRVVDDGVSELAAGTDGFLLDKIDSFVHGVFLHFDCEG